MDKRNLHHIWTVIRPIKAWYILAVFFISAATAAIALRNNNLVMVQLREEVYAADQSGGDVEGALKRLRQHVYAHMNTDLSAGGVYPPIQLKYTYERLREAEKAKVQADNARVYTEAQRFCEAQNPSGFSGRGRVPCIEEYVTAHGVSERRVPDAMYKFDFVSPTWSPDLAGISLVVATLSFILLVLRLAARRILKSLA